MTDDELQAIKARCVAASPRAWHVTRHICREEYSVDTNAAEVCSIRSDAAHCGADALFIAHARTDIPALLGHIAAQQSLLEAFASTIGKLPCLGGHGATPVNSEGCHTEACLKGEV